MERLCRNRSFTRHLPATFGSLPIVVSPDAALRWLKPTAAAFEPSLLEAVDLFVRSKDVVWDIGANVGVFGTAALARGANCVIMIEPDPFLARLLDRTRLLNGKRGHDIRVLCAAIYNRDGCVEFSIAKRVRASNGLSDVEKSSQHGGTRQIILSPALSADTLLEDLPHPDVVKVDVEGAELLFLGGARRLLAEVRPTVAIAIFGHFQSQALDISQSNAYRVFAQVAGKLVPDIRTDWENFVAIPNEKVAGFTRHTSI